jgi:hypothetical protein
VFSLQRAGVSKFQNTQIKQTNRNGFGELARELVHVDFKVGEGGEGTEDCGGKGFVVDIAV